MDQGILKISVSSKTINQSRDSLAYLAEINRQATFLPRPYFVVLHPTQVSNSSRTGKIFNGLLISALLTVTEKSLWLVFFDIMKYV